jgi:adenosylcobinamide-phosphate synthase
MADPTDRVLILIAAFGIEAVLAYPAPLFRAIGHPVSWIGALIGALDCKLNQPNYSEPMRRIAGVAAALLLLGVSLGAGFVLEIVARAPYLGLVFAILAVAALIAGGNLDQHVRVVASALRT